MHAARVLALTVVSVALLIGLAALAVPATAAIAPAPVPTWTVGQEVGYGTNLDLGALADQYLLDAIRQSPSTFNITSIQALNATGSFDAWTVDQVTAATGTYYVLSSESAVGIEFHLLVNVTVNTLPQAGSYTGTIDPYLGCILPSIPKTSGTVAAALDAKALTTANGTTRYLVSDLSTQNTTVNTKVDAKVTASSYNLPMVETNLTACTENVTYDSPSFTLTVNTTDQVRSLFDPSWDSFNFPISDNETWWANSTATIGGTVSGTIDVTGLSSKDEAAFFDNLTQAFHSAGLVVTGLDGFPIDLAQITITAGLDNIVKDGAIQDYPAPVATHFRATGSAMTLSDGNQYPVYLITDASYSCPPSGTNVSLPIGYAAVYAPDFPAQGAGMIVGYELVTCLGTSSLPAFTLTNTKPADAHAKIGQTETKYQAAPTGAGNPIADFFLQAPYWGILVIVAVVVLGAAAVILLRRRRPSVPPPPPPPPP